MSDFRFLDLFSGRALGKVSIFALGIGPYITSSIIMQLMAVIIPALEKLQKEVDVLKNDVRKMKKYSNGIASKTMVEKYLKKYLD